MRPARWLAADVSAGATSCSATSPSTSRRGSSNRSFSATLLPERDPALLASSLKEIPEPLGRGVWVFDASDTTNVKERQTIPLVIPQPAVGVRGTRLRPVPRDPLARPAGDARALRSRCRRSDAARPQARDRRRGHQPAARCCAQSHGSSSVALLLDDLAVARARPRTPRVPGRRASVGLRQRQRLRRAAARAAEAPSTPPTTNEPSLPPLCSPSMGRS